MGIIQKLFFGIWCLLSLSFGLFFLFGLTVSALQLAFTPSLDFPYFTFLLAGISATVLLFIFLILHNILQFFPHTKAATITAGVYKKYMRWIVPAAVVNATVLAAMILGMFSLLPLPFEIVQLVYLFGVVILMPLLYGAILHFPYRRVGRGVVILYLSMLVGIIGYVSYGIYEEFRPQHFLTFPLDDPKGVYIINYDGDYWVTYYTKQDVCTGGGETKTCTKEYVKTGNTSIASSPIDLKPFRDKHVRLSGTFQLTHGSGPLEEKQLCIGEGSNKQCTQSTGPGYWIASPLDLTDIRLDPKQ